MMAESECSLRELRVHRVSLVDRLEGHIDSLLDILMAREVFTRDDQENVTCERGPRERVRRVLDILQFKGEEAARTFLSISTLQRTQTQASRNYAQTEEYHKVMQKHKQVLRRRSESMLYYNTRHGEKIQFSEHYVNLLLVNGHHGLEMKRHEVLAYGQRRLSLQHEATENRSIKPAQLFSDTTSSRPAKKILVTGVAGIGKTILVQKILCDFGNSAEHLGFDFIIHLTFRDLNLIHKPLSFRELVLRKNGHLAKELDSILANDDKLLVILDGFDEFQHYRSCEVEVFVTEPDEEGEVAEVFASLMQGELLSEASVLLTSRPTAISYIPVGCVDRYVLIAGFSYTEIRDFFQRYFQNDDLAQRMFVVVTAHELLLTLCYIPAFCYIVCCILKECKGLSGESPKTMTDIYSQYLVALLRSHTQDRAKTAQCDPKGGAAGQLTNIVLKLGRLAYLKLMDHQTLFYSSDPEVATLAGCSLVSTFLDKTSLQEPGCTEDVYSFTHLTVQEFFAAIYCAMSDHPLPNALEFDASCGRETSKGHLDLFSRFLSGILSQRNLKLLSRHMGVGCLDDKVECYRQGLIREIQALCESGAHILNHLHCLFEQQDPTMLQGLQPKTLHVNVSDETLSPMDYNVIKYFLNLTEGKITELDLTGTDISSEALRELQPNLLRCERIWLGENNLDMDAVKVLADLLQSSDNMMYLGLGWANIGDEELLVMANAIRMKQTLQEIWMEGNKISYNGLSSLSDLSPYPLRKIVAIWNDVSDEEAESLNRSSQGEGFTVTFTDDSMWEEWGQWVFHRCEVSSNEKLVTVLYKVCNISVHCLEIHWARTFYKKLTHLIKTRIEQCTEDDMCRKLERFERMLAS